MLSQLWLVGGDGLGLGGEKLMLSCSTSCSIQFRVACIYLVLSRRSGSHTQVSPAGKSGSGVLAMTASESSRRDVGSPQLRTMTSVHGIPGAFVPLGGTHIPSRYYPQPGAYTSRAAGVGRVQLPARSAVAELDT